MSLRLQMLQVARRGALGLGDSLSVVRDFARTRLSAEGAGLDRDGRPDLYYTIFALAALQALDESIPTEAVRAYLQTFGSGETLDFVHLGALARCWAVVGNVPPETREHILGRLETFRSGDGGYDGEKGAAHGTAYGGFVALGA